MGVARAGTAPSKVVVLAGGTGGAKLARGMLDVVGPEELVVIANTGDDIEIYGAHVSPDPDLISFWLADLIDDRGWGLRGDSFEVMEALRALGVEVWFQLGDRDLAWCIERTRMEDQGMTPTAALRVLCGRIGVTAAVLPMSDDAVRTFVDERPLQEFLIREAARSPIHAVTFRAPGGGERSPEPTREVLAALASARAVIVGPSNPVISIGPIIETIGRALEDVRAPVVAVSPVVGGAILKGPTDAFLGAMGLDASAAGVVSYYERLREGLLDGIVADEAVPGELPRLDADTRMSDAPSRARVAAEVLAFSESLLRT